MYFYNMGVIGWVVKVAMKQLIIYETLYICNLCNYVTTRSLQLLCHYMSIAMPLHYNYVTTTYTTMCSHGNDVLTNHQ
jgi:hypothetical protein